MKNVSTGYYKKEAERNQTHNKVVYCTILGKGEDLDRDWKVEQTQTGFTVTDMLSGKSTSHKVSDFSFEHNSLIKMQLAHGKETLQFTGSQHDLKFDFYF